MVEFFGQDARRRIEKAEILLKEEIIPEKLEYEDLYYALLDCNKHKATTYSAEKFELNNLLNLEILLLRWYKQLPNKIKERFKLLKDMKCLLV